MVTFIICEYRNASAPIDFTEFGIVMVDKEEQDSNAPWPMLVQLFGIDT